MITHDVDEAVLLADRVVMMTNGPAATIGEDLRVDLPRPRNRIEAADSPAYNHAPGTKSCTSCTSAIRTRSIEAA